MSIQSDLTALRAHWCAQNPKLRFPRFYEGTIDAPHTLIMLQSPGPFVKESNVVSPENTDGTAHELQRLVDLAFPKPRQRGILYWNAIPWFLSTKPLISDVKIARPFHAELLQLISPKLRHVVLLGEHARYLLPFFSTRVGKAHIYGGHHPGRQAQIQAGLVSENEAVFSMLRSDG